MKSMKDDEPNYDRVVELMLEVRDKICNVAPRSWKPEIVEASKRDIWKHLSLTSKAESCSSPDPEDPCDFHQHSCLSTNPHE